MAVEQQKQDQTAADKDGDPYQKVNMRPSTPVYNKGGNFRHNLKEEEKEAWEE